MKSSEYGYKTKKNFSDLEVFGERSQDLRDLLSKSNLRVQGIEANDIYEVAVIGDSYVWGQGVKFEGTIAPRLEKLLKSWKKSRVYSFGTNADSILDYLARYEEVRKAYDIDLYVFVLVPNDLLLNSDERLPGNDFKNVVSKCLSETKTYPIYHEDCRKIKCEDLSGQYVAEKLASSWSNKTNLCVLRESLMSLPKWRAIYFFPNETNIFSIKDWDTYKSYLKARDLFILSSAEAKNTSEYERFFGDPERYFQVNSLESHPSKLAHSMYAHLIFEEVFKNPFLQLKNSEKD